MPDESQVPKDERRRILRILTPRNGNEMPTSFSVAGWTNDDSGRPVDVEVSGGDAVEATVTNGGWSAPFEREEGEYTADASIASALSAQTVDFKVRDDAGVEIDDVIGLEMIVGEDEKRHVTITGSHTSSLGPDISGQLFDNADTLFMDHTERTLGNGIWTVRFENVPLGVYAVEITRHINDQRVTASMLLIVV